MLSCHVSPEYWFTGVSAEVPMPLQGVQFAGHAPPVHLLTLPFSSSMQLRAGGLRHGVRLPAAQHRVRRAVRLRRRRLPEPRRRAAAAAGAGAGRGGDRRLGLRLLHAPQLPRRCGLSSFFFNGMDVRFHDKITPRPLPLIELSCHTRSNFHDGTCCLLQAASCGVAISASNVSSVVVPRTAQSSLMMPRTCRIQ